MLDLQGQALLGAPAAWRRLSPEYLATPAPFQDNNLGARRTHGEEPLMPHFHDLPASALADVAVPVRVTGLEPATRVTIRARMRDEAGVDWESLATFIASAAGDVDLGRHAPLDGSWSAVEPMGFLWAMTPQGPGPAAPPVKTSIEPTVITLTAEVNGEVVATAQHTRLAVAEGVGRHVVRDNGLNGVFFDPPGDGPFPTIMLLSGSGGGLSEPQAALYASHGYAALALAYFRGEGLPDDLLRIPLEYFETAIAWLQDRPQVDATRLAVGGGSRGGELSLLLGSRYPVFRAVVATVPSAVVYGAVSTSADGFRQPAWTHGGQGIPFLNSRPGSSPEYDTQPGVGFALTPIFLRSLEDAEAVRAAAIPVERINGPVILISGRADAMWPSGLFSDMVMERLAEHNHPWPDVHLAYDDVGHIIGQPWAPTTVTQSIHPVTGNLFAFGGEPRASAHARADAWPKILAFLDQHLRG